MAFINEKISYADVQEYQLSLVDQRFVVGGTGARHWTVDVALNARLRCVANGREEDSHNSVWTLNLAGGLVVARLERISSYAKAGQSGWKHLKLLELEVEEGIELENDKIVQILINGLTAYKDGGIYSLCSDFKVTLEVPGELK